MFDQLAIRTSEGSDLRAVGKSDPDGAVPPFGHCVLGIRLRQGQLEAFRSLSEKKKLFSRSHPNGTSAIDEHILSVIDEVSQAPSTLFHTDPSSRHRAAELAAQMVPALSRANALMDPEMRPSCLPKFTLCPSLRKLAPADAYPIQRPPSGVAIKLGMVPGGKSTPEVG